MSGKPYFDFLSPREVEGILGDLQQGKSFVDEFLPATPVPAGNGIIKKATSTRFGLPQETAKIEAGQTIKTGPGALFEDVTFRCQEYAWQEGTPWTTAKRAEDYIPLFAYNAQVARDVVATERDVDVATAIAAASWVTKTTVAEADRWNASTSKPNNQLLTLRQSLRPARPTDILMGQDMWAAYMVNANVLDSMNVSADHVFADEQFFMNAVAKKLGFRKLVVIDSMYNTSQINTSQTLAEIFAGKVLLCQVADSPGVSSGSGAVSGMAATALARVVEAPLSLREFDKDDNRTRYAQAHMSETTVIADIRLGGMLVAGLG